MKKFVVLMVVFLVSGIFAAPNPADLTVFHRLFPVRFFLVAYEQGPSMVFNSPVVDDVSFYVFGLQDEKSDFRLCEISASSRLLSFLDIGFHTDITPGGITHDLGLDVRFNRFGLSTVIPFQYRENPRFGARASIVPVTGFATIIPDAKEFSEHTFGINCDYFASVAISYGNETGKIIVAKDINLSFGSLTPEIRMSITNGECKFGGALSFIPAAKN